jgi:hypothetical protein
MEDDEEQIHAEAHAREKSNNVNIVTTKTLNKKTPQYPEMPYRICFINE